MTPTADLQMPIDLRGPNQGSFNERLYALQVGDALWVETTESEYGTIQRKATTVTRFPPAMKNMRFSAHVFTCVSNGRLGDVRICVRIERTQ